MRRNKRGVAGIKARTQKAETLAAQGEKLQNTELAHLDEQDSFHQLRNRLRLRFNQLRNL